MLVPMDSSGRFLKGWTIWRLFCPLFDQEAIGSVRAPDAAQRSLRCAADPGPMRRHKKRGSRLCEAVLRTASRPGHVLHSTKKPRSGVFQFCVIDSQRSVRVGPDLLLGEIQQTREQDQENVHLQPELLAGLHMRLGGP